MDHEKRIAMTKDIAKEWVQNNSRPEYRLVVYPPMSGTGVKDLPTILRAWRDGKSRLASESKPSDLGVHISDAGTLTIWSTDYPKMKAISSWLSRRGYEVEGIW